MSGVLRYCFVPGLFYYGSKVPELSVLELVPYKTALAFPYTVESAFPFQLTTLDRVVCPS